MLILCTDSLKGYGLNRIFALAKEAKYDGIDLNVNFKVFDSFNAKYIKKLIDKHEIPVKAVSAPQNMNSKKLTQLVEFTKKIGAKILVIQPPKILNFKYTNWLKKEVPKLRQKHDISIALENAPAGTILGIFPEHGMSKTSDLKSFKHVCLDTSRLGENGKDLILSYASLQKNLVHVHLSNIKKGQKYTPPQKGILPVESLLSKLRQTNYLGDIAIKIKPKYLHAGEDEEVVAALTEIKKFYTKYYEQVEYAASS
jgi:sugar phosphate isomerase/epimerase